MERLEKQLKLEAINAIKRVSRRILPCAMIALLTAGIHLQLELYSGYTRFPESVSKSINYLADKSESLNPFTYIFK